MGVGAGGVGGVGVPHSSMIGHSAPAARIPSAMRVSQHESKLVNAMSP